MLFVAGFGLGAAIGMQVMLLLVVSRRWFR